MEKKKRLSEEGFTLLELMVVVAIIGVLTSIAIPAYIGYANRAHETEAKLSLSGIFVAETSFFTENGFYTACLKQIGYAPLQGSTTYYFSGFGAAAALAKTCGINGTSPCNAYTVSGLTCAANDVVFGNPQTASDIGYAPNATLLSENSSNDFLFNEAQATEISALTSSPLSLINLSISSGSFVSGAASIDASQNCTGFTLDNNHNLSTQACTPAARPPAPTVPCRGGWEFLHGAWTCPTGGL